jgi:cysteinyl-tRNA synthetase
MIAALHEDADRLFIERPTHEPRATQYVPQMLELIATLEKKGFGYRASERRRELRGAQVSGLRQALGQVDRPAARRRARRGARRQGDPLDFVMWKAAKASEPDDAKWPSEFGPAGPGWHIECSAMCKALLGEQLRHPRRRPGPAVPAPRERDRAERGRERRPFANVWMHNGLLNVDNEKMSKSLGNFFTIRDVLKRYDGETIRFFTLRTHYRSPVNFSDLNLDDAAASLRRLYTALDKVEVAGDAGAPDWNEPRAAAFREAMNDDFNTAIAVSVLFDLAAEVNRAARPEDARQLKALGGVLGLLQQAPRAWLQAGDGIDEASIARRIEERPRRQEGRRLRQGRRDQEEPGGRGHRPQGLGRGHDLGEGLSLANVTTAALAPAVPTADFWDDACRHLSRRDRVMKKLIARFDDGRLESRGDAFTTLARAIVGHQISTAAAQTIWDRFVALTASSSHSLQARRGARRSTRRRSAPRASRRARSSTCATWRSTSSRARSMSPNGRTWTTSRSSRSWSRSAASAAGPRRCS